MPAVYDGAMLRVPDEFRGSMPRPGVRAGRPTKAATYGWRAALAHRQLAQQPTWLRARHESELRGELVQIVHVFGLPLLAATATAAPGLSPRSAVAISRTACRTCSKGIAVPQPTDVPEPLHHLSREEILALRPLDLARRRRPISATACTRA